MGFNRVERGREGETDGLGVGWEGGQGDILRGTVRGEYMFIVITVTGNGRDYCGSEKVCDYQFMYSTCTSIACPSPRSGSFAEPLLAPEDYL
jgi:hypothetical protein